MGSCVLNNEEGFQSIVDFISSRKWSQSADQAWIDADFKNIANFHCTCILVSIFSSFLFNQFLFQNTRNRQKLEILHSLFHTELTKCEFKRVHVDQVKKMFYCQNKEISMEQKKLPNMMIFKEIWQTISLELDYYLTWFWKIE